MAEWLRSLTNDHLPELSWGQKLSFDEAFQLVYKRLVVLPRCLFVTDTRLSGAPGVVLHHDSLRSPYDRSC